MRDLNGVFSSNPPGVTRALSVRQAFVAGAGGLGSNVAMMLVRAGIGSITVADYDVVEAPNLNRQQYFTDQIGLPKVEALGTMLLRVNPGLKLNTVNAKLNHENLPAITDPCPDIVLECFDRAEEKKMLASFCISMLPQVPLVAVSGLAGTGPVENIRVLRKGPGGMIVIGDGETEMTPENGTLSSRVTFAAAYQAHMAISILLEKP